ESKQKLDLHRRFWHPSRRLCGGPSPTAELPLRWESSLDDAEIAHHRRERRLAWVKVGLRSGIAQERIHQGGIGGMLLSNEHLQGTGRPCGIQSEGHR